jgi:hypothetical protein
MKLNVKIIIIIINFTCTIYCSHKELHLCTVENFSGIYIYIYTYIHIYIYVHTYTHIYILIRIIYI